MYISHHRYEYVFSPLFSSEKSQENKRIETEMIFYCQKTYQRNEGNKSFRQKNINSGGLWYFSRILLNILTSQLQRGQSLSGSFVSWTDINISLFKDEPDSDLCLSLSGFSIVLSSWYK